MYTLIMCLFISCLLPYLAKVPLAIAQGRQGKGYDNQYPREQQRTLTGFGARALAAHQNSFESLIIFSSAILTALATQQLSDTVQYLAIGHIITRVAYLACYLLNWATLRSTVWAVGLVMSLSIIIICLP